MQVGDKRDELSILDGFAQAQQTLISHWQEAIPFLPKVVGKLNKSLFATDEDIKVRSIKVAVLVEGLESLTTEELKSIASANQSIVLRHQGSKLSRVLNISLKVLVDVPEMALLLIEEDTGLGKIDAVEN